MSISEARAALPEVIDRVVTGEEITITRHGKVVAVVVRPDALRVRRAEAAFTSAERVRDLLEAGRTESLVHQPTVSEQRAESLLAALRASRSRR